MYESIRCRAFSCDVIATMMEGKDNTFSLPSAWEIRSIFMQNCFIVSALQRGSLLIDSLDIYLSIITTFASPATIDFLSPLLSLSFLVSTRGKKITETCRGTVHTQFNSNIRLHLQKGQHPAEQHVPFQ